MEDQHGLTDDSAFSKLSELLSNSQVTRSEIHQEVQAAMELARDQNIRYIVPSINEKHQ